MLAVPDLSAVVRARSQAPAVSYSIFIRILTRKSFTLTQSVSD